jgi:hypothetical protein
VDTIARVRREHFVRGKTIKDVRRQGKRAPRVASRRDVTREDHVAACEFGLVWSV